MPEPDRPAASEPAANGAAPGPVVVLIEDEAQIRRFLRAALVGSGFRLFEAATGESGIVETATRQPEIVILDLGLPDMRPSTPGRTITSASRSTWANSWPVCGWPCATRRGVG
jgi:DNA-binding response OmpR family regulator